MKTTRISQWIASLGGVGYSPIAPGTAGSLIALPAFWALSHAPIPIYGLVLALVFALSIYTAHQAGIAWQQPDDSRIVIDEVVGMGIACFALEPAAYLWFALAFIAFRVFDIAKPWPACTFDRRCKSGFGTVMDDVAAGVYALGIVQLLKFFLTDRA